MDLPDIDALWDYRDPVASEHRFRVLLPPATATPGPGWHAELLSQLARAVCLQRRHDEAHALLDQATSLLAAAGDRAAIRVGLERGRIHNDTGRTAEAVAAFREAFERADAAAEVHLAADALHMLAYVTRGEESLRWHRAALALCARHDDPRLRRWQVTLHTNMADEYERQGDFASGRRAVEQALAVAEALGLGEAACGSRVFLARLHRLEGNLEPAWEIIQAAFDPNDPRGWSHEEYAECLHARGRIEDARPHFRNAYERHAQDPWFPPTATRRLDRLRRLGAGDADS